jgi:Flp pilus assembly protein TadD
MALYSGAQQRLAQLFGQGGTGDMRQAAAALKAVSDKYLNTKAAAYAQLERANLLYGAGQAKEAAAIYEGVLGKLKAQDPLTLLAKQGLGYCRFATNDLAGAQRIFSELAAVKSAAGTAQLNLGLIYERQGKLKEAVEAYRKTAAEAGGSEATLANARLEALTPGGGA